MEKPVLICVDATKMSAYARQELTSKLSVLTAFQQRVEELIGHIETASVLVLSDDTTVWDHPWHTEYRRQWTEQQLIEVLQKTAAGYGRRGAILLVRADAPLLVLPEVMALLEQHQRYFAHYSFCDGFPQGCTPEILAGESLSLLRTTASETQPLSNIFKIIEKDINAYDIETRISPIDFRMFRLILRGDCKRNLLLCRRIAAALDYTPGQWFSVDDLMKVLQESQAEFRTLPASINWILHSRSPRPAIYYPDIPEHSSCSNDELVSAVARTVEWCGDAMLTFSHLGEPSAHPGIYDLLYRCTSMPNLGVVVETDGIGWDYEQLSQLAERLSRAGRRDSLIWIVFLDADNPELYQRIRPTGDVAAAHDGIDQLMHFFPKTVYVQAVRMDLNEAYMLDFYSGWKEKTERIIVQKYNHYSGALPQRRVADTAPIQRLPCWRLKRELTVLPDGSVPMCHVDVLQPWIAGNICSDSPQEIWEALTPVYHQHIDGRYPAICTRCDEYYTFTF